MDSKDYGRPGGLSSDDGAASVSALRASIPDAAKLALDDLVMDVCTRHHDLCHMGGPCPYCETRWLGSELASVIAEYVTEISGDSGVTALNLFVGARLGAEIAIRAQVIEARKDAPQ